MLCLAFQYSFFCRIRLGVVWLLEWIICMVLLPQTLFSKFLLKAEVLGDADELAANWHDQTVSYRLQGAGALDVLSLGGHLRRSFLGALGRGASTEALNNLPCSWDPPCALDIYMREQFRGAKGDGLPKPYVLFCDADGADLIVSLRVFGYANDWFYVAAEALVTGMREILPWRRLFGSEVPIICERRIEQMNGVELPRNQERMALNFLTPVDASGKSDAIERSLLSRLLRRVDGLARWQGYALDPDYARSLTQILSELDYSRSTLSPGVYKSPNRKAENRHHKTMLGELIAIGDVSAISAFVALGERCHVGRAAVEGLGRFNL